MRMISENEDGQGMVSKDDPSYNIAAIRELLREAFTAAELRRFCQDRSPFSPICYNFGDKYNLNDMVDEVLAYCGQHLLWDELLAEVKRIRGRQYRRYKDQIHPPSEPGVRDAPPPGQDGKPTRPVGEEEPPVREVDHEPPPEKLPAVKGVVLRVLVAAILIVVMAVPLVWFAVLREDGLPCGPKVNPASPPATMGTDLPSVPATAEADTPTVTVIPSFTATLSPTSTPSATSGPSVTPRFPSDTGSSSATLTATLTITPTLTPTLTPTQSPSPTPTNTPTATATATDTPSPTPTAMPTPKPPTRTPTPKPPTPAPTPTDTPRVPPTP
jgi:hypothetical protein